MKPNAALRAGPSVHSTRIVNSLIPAAFVICAVLVSTPAPGAAEKPVMLELVLAVDVSSSVDDHEYQLQVDGYVSAFRDTEVIAAIEALGPLGIAVTYVEWSSRFRQVQSVGWTHIHDRKTSRSFAQAIADNANHLPASGTALGEAVIFSVDLFKNNGFDGARRAIDVSADDRYNAGSSPTYARSVAHANGVTVNGLAVDPTGELTAYFRDNVIVGLDSFVMTAKSYEDIAISIRKKLIREIGRLHTANLADGVQ